MAKSSNPKPSASDPEMMDALKDWVRSSGADYLKDPNITSVGIGYKIDDGETTDDIAIQFTVGRKAAPEMLEALETEPIPEAIEVNGVEIPTDVIQRDFAVEYRVVAEVVTSERKKRLNPIVPGASVAHVKETAGTIGCIVFDTADGTPYILSNWHVLHGPRGDIGDDIVQPGPFDDNRTHLNRVGKLVRSHVGHAGDCAVATIEDRDFCSEIIDLGVRVEQIGEPELGDTVVKSGRTTGLTFGRVTRIHTIAAIDYEGNVGEQEVGCFEIGIDPSHEPDDGEVSKGGDSGSVWLFTSRAGKPTPIMAGLHFAGEVADDPHEHALACYPKSVFEKLEVSLTPPSVAIEMEPAGYQPTFLSERVEAPKLSAAVKAKAFMLDGSEVIPYTHFSLALNKERAFAIWVAWNIDGGGLMRLDREGIPFIVDPRIPTAFQTDDDLYAGNRLDRGHVARRADLLWGGRAEAERANTDSFFFTNITPQMDDFNQSSMGGLWGRLEDAVFEEVDVDDLRVSAFGGPVLRDDDRAFRHRKIPREFWKVLAFVESGNLKAKGFLLTQSLDPLEALDLNEFKVFQVALTEIETRCGLRFPSALKDGDAVGERLAAEPEAFLERQPLESLADIDWS
jgi:endonuclease G